MPVAERYGGAGVVGYRDVGAGKPVEVAPEFGSCAVAGPAVSGGLCSVVDWDVAVVLRIAPEAREATGNLSLTSGWTWLRTVLNGQPI
jgi:hypothetical protein